MSELSPKDLLDVMQIEGPVRYGKLLPSGAVFPLAHKKGHKPMMLLETRLTLIRQQWRDETLHVLTVFMRDNSPTAGMFFNTTAHEQYASPVYEHRQNVSASLEEAFWIHRKEVESATREKQGLVVSHWVWRGFNREGRGRVTSCGVDRFKV